MTEVGGSVGRPVLELVSRRRSKWTRVPVRAALPFLFVLFEALGPDSAMAQPPGAPLPPPGVEADEVAGSILSGLARAELPGHSSVAVDDDVRALFSNPAGLDRSLPLGYLLLWESAERGGSDLASFGLGAGPLGLGYQRVFARRGEDISRWTFALGGGTRRPLSVGLRAARERQERPGPDAATWRWDAGLLWRPHDAVSAGALVEDANQGRIFGRLYRRAYTLGVALRPLPWDRRSRCTLFADLTGEEERRWNDASRLNLGLVAEPIAGVELSGSVRGRLDRFGDEPVFRIALGVSTRRTTSWYGARHDRSAGPREADRIRSVFAVQGAAVRQRAVRREPVVAKIQMSGAYGDEAQGGLPLPIPMLGSPSWSSIRPVLAELDRAARDPDVRGVLLDLGPLAAGPLTSEVRDAIGRIRAAGKPVVAYMDDCDGPAQYHVASACDRIVLDPWGTVTRLGLRYDLLYYGELLDSAGVKFEKVAHGKYKTAGETLVLNRASDGQKEALNALFDDWREVYLTDFARGRTLSGAELEALCDGRMIAAEEARSAGLVDTVADREAARKLVNRLAGRPEGAQPVSVRGWADRKYGWADGRKVAVLWLDGGIETGKSSGGFLSENVMGAETVVKQLHRLRDRADVKAVVLRVDSPGGSGLASDQIWRAVDDVRKKGKTVVVSMSRVAGSGGYFISCGADEIFANPMTITGSIGVLGLKPQLAGFYRRHRIGVETFERGRMMGMYTSAVPLTEEQRTHIQGLLDEFYEKFLARVTAGRPLGRDEVDAVGQGRIWSGRQALERKLIDRIGGLYEATARARELAGLPDDAPVVHLRQPRWSLLSAVRDEAAIAALGLGSLARLCDPPAPAAARAPRAAGEAGKLATVAARAATLSPTSDPISLWCAERAWTQARRPGSSALVLYREPMLDWLVREP